MPNCQREPHSKQMRSTALPSLLDLEFTISEHSGIRENIGLGSFFEKVFDMDKTDIVQHY